LAAARAVKAVIDNKTQTNMRRKENAFLFILGLLNLHFAKIDFIFQSVKP
jgi:hypothetical protein